MIKGPSQDHTMTVKRRCQRPFLSFELPQVNGTQWSRSMALVASCDGLIALCCGSQA